MLIVSIGLGIFTLIFCIIVIPLGVYLPKKYAKLEKNLKTLETDLYSSVEANNIIESILNVRIAFLIFTFCLLTFCFSVWVTYIDFSNIDKYEKYRKTIYEFHQNNSITKTVKECTRMRFDVDPCQILSSETKTVQEIFGGESESNKSN